MSASMMRGLPIFREPLTYSKLKAFQLIVRCQGYCEFNGIISARDKFERDSKGDVTGIHERKFPQHVPTDPEQAAKFHLDPDHHFKKHAGIMRLKTVHIPDLLHDNLRVILAESNCLNKGFQEECKHLTEVFKHRHPPSEKRDLHKKYSNIVDKVIDEKLESEDISLADLTIAQQQQLADSVDAISRQVYFSSQHNWKPISFSGRDALVYVAAKLLPNYAVMLQILQEIKRDNPDYVPDLVYNFGSGSCSAVWAAETLWEDKVLEYYCVDSSKDMNRLAQKLMALDIDDPARQSSIKNVHFRMFPSSAKNEYSLVISGYLLHEMLQEQRLQLVQTLWQQTAEYMVLVEYGTRSGYHLIMEARDAIVNMADSDPDMEGHIIAPCTHDNVCPKQVMKSPVCTFDVNYGDLSLARQMTRNFRKHTEKYIYVIFKKGKRVKDHEYPRILEKKVGTRRSNCLLCCPDGEMNNFVVGKGSSDKALHWSLKRAGNGDLLPVFWSKFDPETYKEERQHGRLAWRGRSEHEYHRDNDNNK